VTPELVARKYQFREGVRLVDYGEVGLPIFRLTLEAVTMAHRSMPTIQEFAVRCIALGETRETDIARMLGLKVDVVVGAINILISDGYVTRQPSDDASYSFELTDAGEERLGTDRLEVPQEEMIVIDYDGVRRVPLRLTGESVVRAAELQGIGAVQIRPYPAEPPAVDELSIPDVSKVIRRQDGEDFHRTLLALKRAVRRNNLFREAVALVFAAEKSEEVQVAFAIYGKLSDAYERAFAEHGGPRKMGFVRALTESDTKKRLERLVGRTMYRSMPDPASLKDARTKEADALLEVDSTRPVASRISGRARGSNPAVLALATAEERLATARHTLDSFDARPLACYEQTELLDIALKEARRSLIITSAGIQLSVVNGARLRELDLLAAAGVQIEVESFLTPQTEPRGGDRYDPLAELSKRQSRGALTIRKGQQRDFFYLVQDDELAVVCSRPFLGEVSRRTGFLRVEGIITRRTAFVEEIRRIALGEREAGRHAH
jgi:DNA-binding MarR family transcriptional regulator